MLREIVEAQRESGDAVAAMADLAAAGGAKYTAAISAAADATTRLEIAIKAVQAAGGPVPPAAIAEFAAYDAAVAAATASTVKGASATKIFGEEANLARGNVGGMARALAGAATSGDGLTASFAKVALPIGAAVAAAALLPTVLDKIDKGTKSLSESLSNLINGLDDTSGLTKKAGESWEQYSARQERVYNTNADVGRSMLGVVQGLIQEGNTVKETVAAWQGHEAAMHGALSQYPEFEKALKSLGVNFRATFDELTQHTQNFENAYTYVFRTEGPAVAKAWAEDNKQVLDKIITDYQRGGKVVPAELLKIADSIHLVSTATKELAKDDALVKKFNEEITAADRLAIRLQDSVKDFGNAATAVVGLRKEIEAHIKALEALTTTNVQQDTHRKIVIKDLQDELNAHANLIGKLEAEDKAYQALRGRIAELSKELDTNAKAFVDHTAKIEEDRVKAIAAAEATTAKVITSLQEQVRQTEAAHAARTISDSAYFTKINTLVADEAKAKQIAYDDEKAINADAQTKQADLVTKDTEAKDKIVKNLEDLGISIADAKKVRLDYYASVKGSVAALEDEEKRTASVKVAVDAHRLSQAELAKELSNLDPIKGSTTQLQNHHSAHTNLHVAVPKTAKHVAELGDQFVQTSGDIPPLNANIDSLIRQLGALGQAARDAAAAMASVTDGSGGGLG